jgi:hypothetical protein
VITWRDDSTPQLPALCWVLPQARVAAACWQVAPAARVLPTVAPPAGPPTVTRAASGAPARPRASTATSRATGWPPTRTLAEPVTMASTGPTQVQRSPPVAIVTPSQVTGCGLAMIGPPPWSGHGWLSPVRAAINLVMRPR